MSSCTVSDIRTSWRKAIQNEEFCDVSSPVEEPCVESLVEQESAHCSLVDLSMACFLSASHLSEHNEPSDQRMSLSTGKPDPHEKAALSQNLTPSLASEIKWSERDKCTPLKECVRAQLLQPAVGDQNDTFIFDDQPGDKLKDRTMIIPAVSQEITSAHSTLSWNSSKAMDLSISSESHDVIQFGILQETIPEGDGNLSLTSTTSAQTPEVDRYSTRVESELPSDREGGWEPMERKMDIHSIRTRYEALKRSFFTSLTEETNSVAHTPLSRVDKQKSESSLPTETICVFSPLDKVLTLDLDLDYLNTPSPRDRKLSLPQLIAFSPCEDDVHAGITEDFPDVFESRGNLYCCYTLRYWQTFWYIHLF